MAKAPFSESMFTPTDHYSAKEKLTFARQFVRMVERNFPDKDFSQKFYERLSNCRGHIAHYNRIGFWDVWFRTPEQKISFLQHWIECPIYGDPAYTHSDVERALRQWLMDGDWLEKQRLRSISEQDQLDAADRTEQDRKDALAGQSRQDFKVVAKSANTNSFGHHQYVLVAKDGACWMVHRTLSFPWAVGQVVTARLDPRREPIFEGCECPQRLRDVPVEKAVEAFEGGR